MALRTGEIGGLHSSSSGLEEHHPCLVGISVPSSSSPLSMVDLSLSALLIGDSWHFEYFSEYNKCICHCKLFFYFVKVLESGASPSASYQLLWMCVSMLYVHVLMWVVCVFCVHLCVLYTYFCAWFLCVHVFVIFVMHCYVYICIVHVCLCCLNDLIFFHFIPLNITKGNIKKEF